MILDAIFVLIGLMEGLVSLPFFVIDKIITATFPGLVSSSNSSAAYLGELFGYLKYFNGIIAIDQIVLAVVFVISVWFAKYLLKWAIALFNATPWIKFHIPSSPTKKAGDR